MVPIFSYKNRYIVTPKIQELYKDSALQKELVFFVVRTGKYRRFRFNSNDGLYKLFILIKGSKDCVSFYECFRMICAFDHGSLVKDVVNKMKANNIDEK